MKKKIQNDSRETVSLGFRYLTVYLFKQIHPLCLRGCVGVFSLATIFILSSVHTTVTAGGWESSSSLTLFSTAGSADCVLTVQGCCFFAAVSECPALIAAPFCRCQSTESAGASVNCGCWSSSYPEFPHFLHWTSLIASAVIAVFYQFCGLRPCTHLTGKSYFHDRPDMAYMFWGGLAWGHSNAYACWYTMWKKVLDRTSTFFNSGIFSLSPAADLVQTFSGNC